MIKQISLLLFSVFAISSISAQIDGDNIFDTDQIVSIELEFPETDFWATLVSNYDADENEYIWADLTLTDVTGTTSFDSVGVRLKGNSSYGHPGNKKSFKLDFNKFVTGQDYDGLKKLNFSNGFKDPAVIREKIFFDVCQAAGVAAPRTSFADVYFNGTHWGFYTIIEQIDDQFLDWAIEDDDGNLFKAGANFGGGPGGGGNAADLVYYGAEQSLYEERYDLKTNEDLNDWTDLIEFIDFVDNSTSTDFEAGIEARLELTEYLRSAALDALFSNLDSYTGSARNYYIYHNQMTNRWEWIHWDGNEAFGSYTNNAGNMLTLSLDYYNSDRPLLDQIMSNENLSDQYLEQVCYLLDNFFNSDYMDARIDEVKTLVQASVYADDNKMYSNSDFDTNIESNLSGGGGPGGGTVYGLKYFVAQRADYAQAVLDCGLFTGLDEFPAAEFTMFPNPAEDQVTVTWEGDDVKNIRLLDAQGRIILEQGTTHMSFLNIDLSGFSMGLYIVQMESGNGAIASRRLSVN